MSQYYKESGLIFSFPKNWFIIKSDEHRFYRYLSGRGFKGVDFIAINHTGQLLLIEVKNYGDRFPADGILPTTILVENTPAYAKKYIKKYEDTFRLINIVHQVYLRKYWFRKIALPLLKRWYHPKMLKVGWVFWWAVHQRLEAGPEQSELLLWLELGNKISKNQTIKLQKELKLEFQNHFSMEPWSITVINKESMEKFGIVVQEEEGF